LSNHNYSASTSVRRDQKVPGARSHPPALEEGLPTRLPSGVDADSIKEFEGDERKSFPSQLGRFTLGVVGVREGESTRLRLSGASSDGCRRTVTRVFWSGRAIIDASAAATPARASPAATSLRSRRAVERIQGTFKPHPGLMAASGVEAQQEYPAGGQNFSTPADSSSPNEREDFSALTIS
jgi:hypothetical protein